MKSTTVILLLVLSSYFCAVGLSKETEYKNFVNLQNIKASQLKTNDATDLENAKESQLATNNADYSSC